MLTGRSRRCRRRSQRGKNIICPLEKVTNFIKVKLVTFLFRVESGRSIRLQYEYSETDRSNFWAVRPCDHPRLTCLTFQLYLTMIFRNNCTIFVVLKKSTVIHHDLLLPKPSKWISEIGGKLWKNSIDLNLVSISLRLVQGPAVCPVPGHKVYRARSDYQCEFRAKQK